MVLPQNHRAIDFSPFDGEISATAILRDLLWKDKAFDDALGGEALTLEKKQEILTTLLALGSHSEVQGFAQNYFKYKAHKRVLFFGDLAALDDWSEFEVQCFTIPVALGGSEVIDAECEELATAFCEHFAFYSDDLREALQRIFKWNVTRNLRMMPDAKIVDSVRMLREDVRNGFRDQLVDRVETARTVFVEAEASVDGPRLLQFLIEDSDEELDSDELFSKFSFNDLVQITDEIRSEGLNRDEAYAAFALHLVPQTKSAEQAKKILRRAKGNAVAFLNDFSVNLSGAVDMYANLLPELEVPDEVGVLKLKAEIAHLNVFELICTLVDLMRKENPTKDELIQLQEIQLVLLMIKVMTHIDADETYASAKPLAERYGGQMNEAIRPDEVEHLHVFKDNRGNYFLDDFPGARKEVLDVRIYNDLDGLRVILPEETYNRKKRNSVMLKLLKRMGAKPKDLSDLFRTRDVFVGNPSREQIFGFFKKKMDKLGLRHREVNSYCELESGEWWADFLKMNGNGNNSASNGYRAVKLYYRTLSETDNSDGVGCEEQGLFFEDWLNVKSPDHILHNRFYDPNKLRDFVGRYPSLSLYPQLHEAADFIEKASRLARSRAAQNGGWVKTPDCLKEEKTNPASIYRTLVGKIGRFLGSLGL